MNCDSSQSLVSPLWRHLGWNLRCRDCFEATSTWILRQNKSSPIYFFEPEAFVASGFALKGGGDPKPVHLSDISVKTFAGKITRCRFDNDNLRQPTAELIPGTKLERVPKEQWKKQQQQLPDLTDTELLLITGDWLLGVFCTVSPKMIPFLWLHESTGFSVPSWPRAPRSRVLVGEATAPRVHFCCHQQLDLQFPTHLDISVWFHPTPSSPETWREH